MKKKRNQRLFSIFYIFLNTAYTQHAHKFYLSFLLFKHHHQHHDRQQQQHTNETHFKKNKKNLKNAFLSKMYTNICVKYKENRPQRIKYQIYIFFLDKNHRKANGSFPFKNSRSFQSQTNAF